MSEFGWVLLQFLFIFLRYQKRNSFSFMLCVVSLSYLPMAVRGDRTAFVDISRGDGPDTSEDSADVLLQAQGSYAGAGDLKKAGGELHFLNGGECGEEDEEDLSARPLGEWVAILNYPQHASQRFVTNDSDCQSVLDRVKKAMLFGASAIIILALNPKIVKELDIAQLFSRPVILIQEVENVTAILSVLVSKISMRVMLTYNTSFYELQKVSTLTLWATCGRSSGVNSYNEWEGVVCLGNEGVSKADPGHFWSYFFSALCMILLLLIIKARRGGHDTTDEVEMAMRQLAHQALSVMKWHRYKPAPKLQDLEMCAVCLDQFYAKQKIRELPCFHKFHTKCVDPWLVKQRTCPLCKRNILDNIPLGKLVSPSM